MFPSGAIAYVCGRRIALLPKSATSPSSPPGSTPPRPPAVFLPSVRRSHALLCWGADVEHGLVCVVELRTATDFSEDGSTANVGLVADCSVWNVGVARPGVPGPIKCVNQFHLGPVEHSHQLPIKFPNKDKDLRKLEQRRIETGAVGLSEDGEGGGEASRGDGDGGGDGGSSVLPPSPRVGGREEVVEAMVSREAKMEWKEGVVKGVGGGGDVWEWVGRIGPRSLPRKVAVRSVGDEIKVALVRDGKVELWDAKLGRQLATSEGTWPQSVSDWKHHFHFFAEASVEKEVAEKESSSVGRVRRRSRVASVSSVAGEELKKHRKIDERATQLAEIAAQNAIFPLSLSFCPTNPKQLMIAWTCPIRIASTFSPVVAGGVLLFHSTTTAGRGDTILRPAPPLAGLGSLDPLFPDPATASPTPPSRPMTSSSTLSSHSLHSTAMSKPGAPATRRTAVDVRDAVWAEPDGERLFVLLDGSRVAVVKDAVVDQEIIPPRVEREGEMGSGYGEEEERDEGEEKEGVMGDGFAEVTPPSLLPLPPLTCLASHNGGFSVGDASGMIFTYLKVSSDAEGFAHRPDALALVDTAQVAAAVLGGESGQLEGEEEAQDADIHSPADATLLRTGLPDPHSAIKAHPDLRDALQEGEEGGTSAIVGLDTSAMSGDVAKEEEEEEEVEEVEERLLWVDGSSPLSLRLRERVGTAVLSLSAAIGGEECVVVCGAAGPRGSASQVSWSPGVGMLGAVGRIGLPTGSRETPKRTRWSDVNWMLRGCHSRGVHRLAAALSAPIVATTGIEDTCLSVWDCARGGTGSGGNGGLLGSLALPCAPTGLSLHPSGHLLLLSLPASLPGPSLGLSGCTLWTVTPFGLARSGSLLEGATSAGVSAFSRLGSIVAIAAGAHVVLFALCTSPGAGMVGGGISALATGDDFPGLWSPDGTGVDVETACAEGSGGVGALWIGTLARRSEAPTIDVTFHGPHDTCITSLDAAGNVYVHDISTIDPAAALAHRPLSVGAMVRRSDLLEVARPSRPLRKPPIVLTAPLRILSRRFPSPISPLQTTQLPLSPNSQHPSLPPSNYATSSSSTPSSSLSSISSTTLPSATSVAQVPLPTSWLFPVQLSSSPQTHTLDDDAPVPLAAVALGMQGSRTEDVGGGGAEDGEFGRKKEDLGVAGFVIGGKERWLWNGNRGGVRVAEWVNCVGCASLSLPLSESGALRERQRKAEIAAKWIQGMRKMLHRGATESGAQNWIAVAQHVAPTRFKAMAPSVPEASIGGAWVASAKRTIQARSLGSDFAKGVAGVVRLLRSADSLRSQVAVFGGTQDGSVALLSPLSFHEPHNVPTDLTEYPLASDATWEPLHFGSVRGTASINLGAPGSGVVSVGDDGAVVVSIVPWVYERAAGASRFIPPVPEAESGVEERRRFFAFVVCAALTSIGATLVRQGATTLTAAHVTPPNRRFLVAPSHLWSASSGRLAALLSSFTRFRQGVEHWTQATVEAAATVARRARRDAKKEAQRAADLREQERVAAHTRVDLLESSIAKMRTRDLERGAETQEKLELELRKADTRVAAAEERALLAETEAKATLAKLETARVRAEERAAELFAEKLREARERVEIAEEKAELAREELLRAAESKDESADRAVTRAEQQARASKSTARATKLESRILRAALEGEIGRLKEALRSAEEKALAAAAQAEHEKKRAEAMAANLTVARAQAAEEARAAAKAVGETADAEHRIETLRHTRTLLFDELDAAKMKVGPVAAQLEKVRRALRTAEENLKEVAKAKHEAEYKADHATTEAATWKAEAQRSSERAKKAEDLLQAIADAAASSLSRASKVDKDTMESLVIGLGVGMNPRGIRDLRRAVSHTVTSRDPAKAALHSILVRLDHDTSPTPPPPTTPPSSTLSPSHSTLRHSSSKHLLSSPSPSRSLLRATTSSSSSSFSLTSPHPTSAPSSPATPTATAKSLSASLPALGRSIPRGPTSAIPEHVADEVRMQTQVLSATLRTLQNDRARVSRSASKVSAKLREENTRLIAEANRLREELGRVKAEAKRKEGSWEEAGGKRGKTRPTSASSTRRRTRRTDILGKRVKGERNS